MIEIYENLCTSCGECVSICEVKDIKLSINGAKPLGLQCTECGHCVAICPENAIALLEYDPSESIEYQLETFDIDPLVLSNFMKYRRSTRRFLSQKVENEKIEQILQAGRYSPTACNDQDLRYVVIEKDMDVARDMLWEGGKTYAEKEGDQYLLSRYHRYIESNKKSDALLYGCSHLIFILAPQENDACIASSRMELMANALGLGALYLGYCKLSVEASPLLQEYLGENDCCKTQAVLAIGYTNIKWQRTVPRKPIKAVWK